ncbi:hypothetical protein Avbf_05913 [Armadillidium vulgare]|nr:hypothetical protein Avbf_05913 [Armadillidium vulgare]
MNEDAEKTCIHPPSNKCREVRKACVFYRNFFTILLTILTLGHKNYFNINKGIFNINEHITLSCQNL